MKTKLLLLSFCIALFTFSSCTKESDCGANISDESVSRLASEDGFTFMTSASRLMSTVDSCRIRMNEIAQIAYNNGVRSDFPANSMFVKEKYDAAGNVTGFDIKYRAPADPN